MDIADWRVKIDELDRQIVALISERARAAQQIGRLKQSSTLPVYEPNRETVVFANVRAANHGPIPDNELVHIYERLIDVMRSLQQDELVQARSGGSSGGGPGGGTGGVSGPRTESRTPADADGPAPSEEPQ